MRQFSPWSVYYTGQPIEDGIFGLTSHNTIKNSSLNGKNKIDIYKAKVGSRRSDIEPQQKLPLKTALYILKDKDEKILFDIPVAGNIDSPEFSYMKIVWKTLGNLLVKVATSPVRALGNVFGFGNDNLEFIEIEAHQRGLTSEHYHILGDLATIAKSDSLVHFTLEQRMPAPANDTVARGYEFRSDEFSADEYSKQPFFNFEIHRALIDESVDFEKAFAYYKDVKKRLVKDSGNKYGYHFTDDDYYIFFIFHAFKHYDSRGTGFRTVADEYVILSSDKLKLDFGYISKELEKLGIAEFEERLRELAVSLFSEPELTEENLRDLSAETREMLEFIFRIKCKQTFFFN